MKDLRTDQTNQSHKKKNKTKGFNSPTKEHNFEIVKTGQHRAPLSEDSPRGSP